MTRRDSRAALCFTSRKTDQDRLNSTSWGASEGFGLGADLGGGSSGLVGFDQLPEFRGEGASAARLAFTLAELLALIFALALTLVLAASGGVGDVVAFALVFNDTVPPTGIPCSSFPVGELPG